MNIFEAYKAAKNGQKISNGADSFEKNEDENSLSRFISVRNSDSIILKDNWFIIKQKKKITYQAPQGGHLTLCGSISWTDEPIKPKSSITIEWEE